MVSNVEAHAKTANGILRSEGVWSFGFRVDGSLDRINKIYRIGVCSIREFCGGREWSCCQDFGR